MCQMFVVSFIKLICVCVPRSVRISNTAPIQTFLYWALSINPCIDNHCKCILQFVSLFLKNEQKNEQCNNKINPIQKIFNFKFMDQLLVSHRNRNLVLKWQASIFTNPGLIKSTILHLTNTNISRLGPIDKSMYGWSVDFTRTKANKPLSTNL